MNPKNRLFFFSLVAVVTLLVNLALPINVFADDATPPPAATEEPAQPPTNPIATEAPVQSSTDPVATEAPVVSPTEEATQEATQEAAPAEKEPTVAEVLDQVPDDTQVVVLNEQGENVPLASQEAADIMSDADTDPMWCPASDTTVTAACVKANTVTLLLPLLATKSGAGVIYFKPNYNTNDVTFNQIINSAQLGSLTDLTFQGGWDGVTTLATTIAYSGQSVFTVPVTIVWNYGVTVNNFTVQNAIATGLSIDNSTATTSDVNVNDSVLKKTQNGYDGLDVNSQGRITLTNVTANNNTGAGTELDNSSGTGNITLNGINSFNQNGDDGLDANSNGDITLNGTNVFNANNQYGLFAQSGGNVSLNNVSADRNVNQSGVYIDNTGGTDTVDLTGTNEFNANSDDGLEVYSNGDISFDGASDTNANRNGAHGIYLYNAYGGTAAITLNNITANFNDDGNGVFAYAAGDVTINNGYFKGNDRRGVYVQSASGDIDVSLSDFINNGMSGLRAEAYSTGPDLTHGNIILDQISSEKNGIHGANLGATGDITITDDSEFINNDESGVHIMGLFGNLTVSESLFSGNDRHGLDAEYVDGDVNIDGSVFTFNKRNGLNLLDVSESINITGSDFLNNKHDGAYLYNCGCTISDITIDSSNFNDNGWSGLEAYSYGEISLTNVTADGNLDGDGAYLNNTYGSGNIFVDPSEFNNNSNYGLNIFTNGDIKLSEVTANGNGYDGVYLDTSGNATICDSTFTSNITGYGVNASNVSGTLTMGNNTFSPANGAGDYSYGGPVSDCNPSSGGGSGKKRSQTGSIIPVMGGQEVTCDVAATSTTFELPNGDKITLPCPINDFAFVNQIVEGGLPGSVGDGNHFLSALNANVIRNSQTVQSLEEPMTISFIIPDGIKADGLAIMLWDGTQWVKLDGKVSADGLHFEVITKSTGTFALVNK